MTRNALTSAVLSDQEMELIRMVAQRDGITEEEAATNLTKAALARRTRKRTGRGPARVYQLKR